MYFAWSSPNFRSQSKFLSVGIVQLCLLISATSSQSVKGPNLQPAFMSGGDLTRFTLPEDTKVGTVVYRLKGNDPENGELIYSISGEYFRVNKKTGDLTLIKELDRETEASIDVIISLTDNGNGGEPETISLRREILVTDVNDNAPVFHKKPYSFRISEKARVGSSVQSDIIITDEDFEENAQISLSCAEDETPVACSTFSVSVEKLGEGNYVGIISLERPLDYEQHSSYALTMRATDGLNVVPATVHIIVIDHQDEPPRFFEGPYVFKIKENSWPGTELGTFSVQDGDVGNPRELQIKLIDEASNNYFRLSSISRDKFTGTYTAVVETSESAIDAEDEFIRQNLGVYELTLEAREVPLGPHDTEATQTTRIGLAIIVQDVDDNLPTFNPTQQTDALQVPYNEDESYIFPNFHVTVEDVDVEPENSKFSLQFDWTLEDSATPVDEVFGFVTPSNANPVIQSKGVVTLEVLNISLLEPGSSFDLQVGAYQDEHHLVAKFVVPIQVAPHGKILPIFNNTIYRISVSEDIQPGEVITKVNLQNHNEVPLVKYSIVGDNADHFDVDESTGEIRCAIQKCLDYEKEKQHFFLVKGKTGDTIEDEVFALLYLDVVEANDNYPIFNDGNGVIRRTVPDETTKFDPPFIVSATDADLNDIITYSMVDHSAKNTSSLYIQPESGELKVKKPLLWSEAGEHKLVVRATDKTGKFTEQNVIIVVQPVPNIPPTFPYEMRSVEVSETLPAGSSVYKVKAHDSDGQDAALRYHITPPTFDTPEEYEPDLFLMEETTGVVKLNGQLDYEKKQRLYSLNVRVQDEGKPSQTATTVLEIRVTDENDELPVFERKRFVVEMSETEKSEFSLITLKAVDTDADSKLKYNISCPCQSWDAAGSKASADLSKEYFEHLQINSQTGEIVLAKPLAHKTTSVLEFNALVEDLNGITEQNDTAIVTLYVTAAERLNPYFGDPWTPSNPWINLTIPEDMEIGRNVVTLNAWDYVTDEEITEFLLVDDASVDPFGLEDNVLKIVSPLDYETKQHYIVSVKARDSRGGESIAHLFLNISDVNDHTPVFEKTEYRGKILENSQYPTPILTVQASDRDDVSNYGSIRYNLTGPQSSLFVIDELAGVIQVAPLATLDREKDDSHTIYVLALDTPAGGPFQRTATAVVRIEVEDENDNDPVCKAGEFVIPENVQIGTFVGNLSCSDVDLSTQLVYTLKDDTGLGLFNIDSKSGSVTSAKSLRARGRSHPYLLSVAVDDGKDRRIIVPISITITNVIPNDGKPYFTNTNTTATVSEGAFRGTPILHITANDFDSYDNGEGRLYFKLLKQIYPCQSKIHATKEHQHQHTPNSNHITGPYQKSIGIHVQDVNFFRLDEQSGMLTLHDTIDREKFDCFSILVNVEDFGSPSQSQTQWYEILVNDVDDNLPYIPKAQQTVNLIVNETTPKETTILTLTAYDADIFPNNQVQFELVGSNNNPNMNPSTSVVTIADYFKLVQTSDRNVSLLVHDDLERIEAEELTLSVKCYGKDRKLIAPAPECFSKIHIRLNKDSPVIQRIKIQELIFGAAQGTNIGNLIGNAGMTPMKPIYTITQMFHPNQMSQPPFNVSDVIHVNSGTGDIFVWDNLEPYANGHIRLDLSHDEHLQYFSNQRKRLKIFVMPNADLLSADTADFTKLQKWAHAVELYLNQPSRVHSKISKGFFRFLVFDTSNNTPDGKTKICFQLLENENQVSQEKALQLLNNPEALELFGKYSFNEEIKKGCPSQLRVPMKLTVSGSMPRSFWIERSLVGIASVIIIATMSAILILCLIHRSRGKEDS